MTSRRDLLASCATALAGLAGCSTVRIDVESGTTPGPPTPAAPVPLVAVRNLSDAAQSVTVAISLHGQELQRETVALPPVGAAESGKATVDVAGPATATYTVRASVDEREWQRLVAPADPDEPTVAATVRPSGRLALDRLS